LESSFTQVDVRIVHHRDVPAHVNLLFLKLALIRHVYHPRNFMVRENLLLVLPHHVAFCYFGADLLLEHSPKF
jgi:hypothetical protein